MMATAAPMFKRRIIKIMLGKSFSFVATVEPAAALPLPSMLNGSTAAGAGAGAAGADVDSQEGDADMLLVFI